MYKELYGHEHAKETGWRELLESYLSHTDMRDPGFTATIIGEPIDDFTSALPP